MAEVGSKRSLHLRLDPRLHDQLQQLASESGGTIPDLIRDLLERALNDRTHLELLTQNKRSAKQLDRLEHNIATHLPALHQRLDTLEQLVCAVDANAIRRAPVEHMKLRHLWRNQRYALFEVQALCGHLLQQTMHTNGHKLAEIEARYAGILQEAENAIAEFVPEIRELMAELDADAPAPLQPPPPPDLPPILRPPAAPRPGEDETPTAAHIPADGAAHGTAPKMGQPEGEQPGLFEGNGGSPAAPNGAANGGAEVAR